jgi:hypothetical protein
MRLHLKRDGHDPRSIDLAVVLLLLIMTVCGLEFLNRDHGLSTSMAFIEPSQTVRW